MKEFTDLAASDHLKEISAAGPDSIPDIFLKKKKMALVKPTKSLLKQSLDENSRAKYINGICIPYKIKD